MNTKENTNGQVRRLGSRRIAVVATLAAVAMLGCSDNLNPTAPSAVNAPLTASKARVVATPPSPLTANLLVPTDHDGGSDRPRRETFRRPASLQQTDRQQASPC